MDEETFNALLKSAEQAVEISLSRRDQIQLAEALIEAKIKLPNDAHRILMEHRWKLYD